MLLVILALCDLASARGVRAGPYNSFHPCLFGRLSQLGERNDF